MVLAAFAPCTAVPTSTCRRVVRMGTQQPAAPISRRSSLSALLGLAALPLLLSPGAAEAKDARAAAKASAERKAKLRAAAEAMAETGKSKAAFSTSKYQLPEESTTPNLRTLANDRLRKEE